jgi:hypothetical protein
MTSETVESLKPMRVLLVLASLALLGGCNMLMTKDPLFSRADAAGAPRMRPGVWEQAPAADCTLDESQPLASWPSCASGFVVENDHTVGGFNQRDGKPVWSTTPYLLAAGDPLIFQIHLSDEAGPTPMPPLYVYAAMRPTRFDDRGRITAVTSWAVLCGPPPPADAKGPDGTSPRSGTLEPAAGLTMDDAANDCTTTSQDAARHAAAASEHWTKPDGFTASHWIRDGDH